MSASPPPPPFLRSSDTASERRRQRQILREQQRSASAANRQQRAFARAQVRVQTLAARRRSALGPLFLVTLGAIFLLIEAGLFTWSSVLGAFARWWPLILIASGAILLMEWALDHGLSDGSDGPLPRRTVGAGVTAALLLVALGGLAANGLVQHTGWLQGNWAATGLDGLELEQIFARHSETVHEFSKPLASGGLLEIQNYRGNITVSGASQDGRVHIVARQRLWAWRNRDLRRIASRDRPTLESSGQKLLFQANGSGRDETELTITVPHETSLTINAESGQVAVSEVRGALIIQAHQGDVVLTALTGHLLVTAHDDNAAISGHSLTGDLTVTGRTGDLAFSDITGPVSLHGDFFGATHLERVNGPVRFQSSYTTFTCAGVPGDLNVEGRTELAGSNIQGPVTLDTSNRNVTLANLHGSALLANKEGKVDLSLAAPLAPVTVSTTNGSVHLQVPENSPFRITATTTNGQISDDLRLIPQHIGKQSTLAGQVHTGGPLLQVQTSEADIEIRKQSNGPTSPPLTHPESTDDEDPI